MSAARAACTAVVALAVTVAGCTSQPAPTDSSPSPSASRAPATAPATVPAAAPATPPVEAPVEELTLAQLPEPEWIAEQARVHEIPQRALAAYAGASVAIADLFPSCNLGWETLAGIGAVESNHGTWQGSAIDSGGQTVPAVIGVPLNGDGVREVRDTDDGDLDGDRTWDRAVGPMQFLPATWAEFGMDGNGDDRADPQQIDDATLTAAFYLCGFGDLTVPENWINAVYSYNPSLDYNHKVVEAVNRYAPRA